MPQLKMYSSIAYKEPVIITAGALKHCYEVMASEKYKKMFNTFYLEDEYGIFEPFDVSVATNWLWIESDYVLHIDNIDFSGFDIKIIEMYSGISTVSGMAQYGKAILFFEQRGYGMYVTTENQIIEKWELLAIGQMLKESYEVKNFIEQNIIQDNDY